MNGAVTVIFLDDGVKENFIVLLERNHVLYIRGEAGDVTLVGRDVPFPNSVIVMIFGAVTLKYAKTDSLESLLPKTQ